MTKKPAKEANMPQPVQWLVTGDALVNIVHRMGLHLSPMELEGLRLIGEAFVRNLPLRNLSSSARSGSPGFGPDRAHPVGYACVCLREGPKLVFTEHYVRALLKAIRHLPDTMQATLGAISAVPQLHVQMKKAAATWGDVAYDWQVFDPLSEMQNLYAFFLAESFSRFLGLGAARTWDGSLKGSPALLVAAAEIARSRFPLEVHLTERQAI